ncbi:MAG: hypothetical protein ACR2QG_09620 [Gammaproteobacteria bacterium]
MTGIAKWLATHRVGRIMLTALLYPVFGLLSAAIVVMNAQLRGPREALTDCLLAFAVLTLAGFAAGMDLPVLLAGAAVSWAAWLILGSVKATTGSLTLALQTAVMLAALAGFGFLLWGYDPADYGREILESFFEPLSEQDPGLDIDEEAWARLIGVMMLPATLVGWVIALLFGGALAGRVQPEQAPKQFRDLRMGVVIGVLAAIAGVGAIFSRAADGLLLLFTVGFMFHGLAVLVWWAEQRKWPQGWWIGLCILPILLPDFFVITALLLAAIGFVDNWFDMRRVPAGRA